MGNKTSFVRLGHILLMMVLSLYGNEMGSFTSLVFSTFGAVVVLIVLLLYFTEDFLSLSLQKESCDVMAMLQD